MALWVLSGREERSTYLIRPLGLFLPICSYTTSQAPVMKSFTSRKINAEHTVLQHLSDHQQTQNSHSSVHPQVGQDCFHKPPLPNADTLTSIQPKPCHLLVSGCGGARWPRSERKRHNESNTYRGYYLGNSGPTVLLKSRHCDGCEAMRHYRLWCRTWHAVWHQTARARPESMHTVVHICMILLRLHAHAVQSLSTEVSAGGLITQHKQHSLPTSHFAFMAQLAGKTPESVLIYEFMRCIKVKRGKVNCLHMETVWFLSFIWSSSRVNSWL